MKKRYLFPLIFLILLGVLGFFALKYFTGDSSSKKKAFSLVPKDAIFILETDEPIENWKTISGSEPWEFLKKNEYFAELTSGANYVDSLINDNSKLFGGLGSRQVVISAHNYTKDDYDFLYILDLENISKISGLASRFLGKIDGFKTTKREIGSFPVFELLDLETKEILYISFVENLMLCSYQNSLIQGAIEEFVTPELILNKDFVEVQNEVGGRDLFRAYVHYDYLDEYLDVYLEEENSYVNSLSQDLTFTGLSFNYEDENTLLSFEGVTKLAQDRVSYLSLIADAGASKFTFDEVVPKRVASVVSLGVDDFQSFFDSFLEMSKEGSDGEDYKKNIQKVERFLGISLKKNFISWIGDEVSFVQTQPIGLRKEDEYAVFLKTKDKDEARENLDFIGDQIRKRTPVRFKGVTYNGYEIKFMSVKGMFKLLMGDLFGKIEKPYYTILDEYVVFSNHPQTIKNIIDDYRNKEVLINDESYKGFKEELSKKSSVLIYVNTPVAYSNLTSLTDAETKSDVSENKKYFDAFPHIAFQLVEDGDKFETTVLIDYLDKSDVEVVKRDLELDSEEKRINGDAKSIKISDTTKKSVSLKVIEETALIELENIVLDDLDANLQQTNYDSGELKFEVGIKNGVKHGAYREYSKSGSLILKGKYKDDEKVGTWRYYTASGSFQKKVKY